MSTGKRMITQICQRSTSYLFNIPTMSWLEASQNVTFAITMPLELKVSKDLEILFNIAKELIFIFSSNIVLNACAHFLSQFDTSDSVELPFTNMCPFITFIVPS